MTFKTYTKIKILGDVENKGIFDNIDDEIVIEEKVDGCFNYNMKVDTNKGKLTIGKIVNKKLNVKILSMNLKTKELEYKSIKQYYKNGYGENWKKLSYDYFGKKRYLIVTDNHNVFTSNGLKKIKEINIHKDKLICSEQKLTNNQKDVLIGSILGDGSFRNMNHITKAPIYSETHSIKQKDYLKYKKDILKKLISKEDTWFGQYSKKHKITKKIRIRSFSLYTFRELSNFYINNKKTIPNNIIKYLSPMTLAIWYMDNGSCQFSNKQNPRAKLHMQGLSEENVQKLSKALNKLGILNNIHNYKGWQIDMNAQGTKTFFKIISSYIHPSMNYKISKEHRTDKVYLSDELQEYEQCKINSIISFSPKIKQRYDLEIEDNHNYFVKSILVHNSNFRFMIKNEKIIFGSRTQELTEDKEHKFQKNFNRCIAHIQECFNKLDEDTKKHSEGKIFYGECMTAHTIHYDWEHTPVFLGFDIYDIQSDKFLRQKNKTNLFAAWNLSVVPLIKVCKVSEIGVINDDMVPNSKYISPSAEDTKCEGLVFKNYNKQIFAKCVREKFRERNRGVFGGSKKHAKSDEEYFSLMYCTNARIDKCIFKLLDEGKELSMSLMGELLNVVYADIWEENWREMAYSKKIIDTHNMKKLVSRRVLEVLKQTLINNALAKEVKKIGELLGDGR